MGSTTHVVDEAGAVQNRYEYDAWGNITAQEETIPNRFKFTGQQLDPITQQYYLRARFYNPVIARFTQEDTYRGDGLNLYAYCANNPVFYIDPSGHVPQCLKNAYDKYRQEGKDAKTAYELAQKDYAEAKARGEKIPEPKKPSNDGFKEYVRREQEVQKDLAAQRETWNRYLDDIETQTGRQIPKEQREMVINEGINGADHSRLSKPDHDAHRDDFDLAKKKLRKQWEKETGQTWPRMSCGRRYDAHEIIPNGYNSPLTWWNIHPAAYPNEHQSGIHRSGAPLYDIYPR